MCVLVGVRCHRQFPALDAWTQIALCKGTCAPEEDCSGSCMECVCVRELSTVDSIVSVGGRDFKVQPLRPHRSTLQFPRSRISVGGHAAGRSDSNWRWSVGTSLVGGVIGRGQRPDTVCRPACGPRDGPMLAGLMKLPLELSRVLDHMNLMSVCLLESHECTGTIIHMIYRLQCTTCSIPTDARRAASNCRLPGIDPGSQQQVARASWLATLQAQVQYDVCHQHVAPE